MRLAGPSHGCRAGVARYRFRAVTSLRGRLELGSLTDLLRMLTSTRQTGVLHLGDEFATEIWFVDGAVTYAAADGSSTLRHALETAGALQPGEWDTAAATDDPGGTSAALTAVLGDRGAAVRAVLHARAVDLLTPLLLRNRADRVVFDAGRAHPFGAAFRLELDPVVRDANERVGQWRDVLVVVPTLAAVPQVTRRAGRVDVDDRDRWFFRFVDGTSSIAALVPRTGVGLFAACTTLQRLVTVGAIELHTPEGHWPTAW